MRWDVVAAGVGLRAGKGVVARADPDLDAGRDRRLEQVLPNSGANAQVCDRKTSFARGYPAFGRRVCCGSLLA